MKSLLRPTVLSLASLVLFSCGDSFEKLANDQISLQDDITETLNGVANGELTSSEASAQLEKLVKKGEDISERKLVLVKNLTEKDIEEIAQTNREKIAESNREYSKAFAEVTGSGKMTPELLRSLNNATSSASRNPSVDAIEAAGEEILKEMEK